MPDTLASRYTGLDVSVFTAQASGGSTPVAYLGALENCTINIQNNDMDGKGINERFRRAIAIGSEIEITASVFANKISNALLGLTMGPGKVDVVFTDGVDNFTATGIISISKEVGRDQIQSYRVTIKGHGAPSVSAAS